MWASLGGVPGPMQKKRGGGVGGTLAYDPGLTPQLVQVHGLGPRAKISAWDT